MDQAEVHSKSYERFGEKAAEWDDNPTLQDVTALVKTWITTQPWWEPPLNGPAMDFGCGTGCLTMALRDGLGESVVGVDTSRAMLEQFKRKAEGQGVTTVAIELTGPGQLGKDADSSFALIYTCLTLHHIEDRESTISALATYLRPGGRLLMFDFELGNHPEHHGIREADLRAWCENTWILKDFHVERIPFRKEDSAPGKDKECYMLACSCVKKVSGRASAAIAENGSTDRCMACKRGKVEYECVPCGCHAFCKGCAMKLATGGRCKICKNMFTGLRKLRLHPREYDESGQRTGGMHFK